MLFRRATDPFPFEAVFRAEQPSLAGVGRGPAGGVCGTVEEAVVMSHAPEPPTGLVDALDLRPLRAVVRLGVIRTYASPVGQAMIGLVDEVPYAEVTV